MESAKNPGYFAPQDWLPTPGLRVAGDRPTGGAHGWLKSAAGRAAGNELRTRKKYVSDRDARFKQPLERCKLLTRWAFEYFDQTTSNPKRPGAPAWSWFLFFGTRRAEMRARTNDEIMQAWCRQTGDRSSSVRADE